MTKQDNTSLESPPGTRTETVVVRLTPKEKDGFVQEAQKLGISISAFMRLLLRNWADGIKFEKRNPR